jgi:hypothetical protein
VRPGPRPIAVRTGAVAPPAVLVRLPRAAYSYHASEPGGAGSGVAGSTAVAPIHLTVAVTADVPHAPWDSASDAPTSRPTRAAYGWRVASEEPFRDDTSGGVPVQTHAR